MATEDSIYIHYPCIISSRTPSMQTAESSKQFVHRFHPRKTSITFRQGMFTGTLSGTPSTISHLDNYILSIFHYLGSPS